MRYVLLGLLFTMTGCTQVQWAKHNIANGVDSYCNQVTLEQRTIIRNEVNAELAQKGNSIKVTCHGDPN